MFTGIIEELGTIGQIKAESESLTLSIQANKILHDIALGDSIAVNGVCLTVTSFNHEQFNVDVMPQTYRATNLSKLKAGNRVNLESSLRMNGKLGGHFVTGHIDGIGTIKKITPADNAINYQIEIDSSLNQFCIYKGSIAIDGTSLTIFGLKPNSIDIALIPHTVKNSVIGSKKAGDSVNIECDMLGKYVLNLARQYTPGSAKTNLTAAKLAEHGFI